ncbi:hypothetical protein BH09ACT10_BH09ACT10_14680 [soil metagenome]
MKFTRLAFAATVSAALLLSACSSSDDGSSGGSDGGSAGASGKITDKDVATALAYVGGEAGKADSSLEPFVIGFVNNQGGVPSFQEQEAAADGAVYLINNKLGGVDGHPVELKKCFIQAEEDGQKCAGQLLDAKVSVGVLALSVFGNKSFYDLVGQKFPVINSVSVMPEDSTSKDVYALDGGGLGAMYAMAQNAEDAGYKSLAIITTSNPAGKFLLANVVLPDLKARGIAAKVAYMDEGSTTPQYVTALQTTGAATADAVQLIPSGVAGCVATYDAMKQISLVKPVVTVITCSNDPMPEKTGGGADGWILSGQSDIMEVQSAQSDTVRHAMDDQGGDKFINIGNVPKGFGDILSLVKFAKTLGYDKITPEAMNEQILAFKGPAWMIPGTIDCGANTLQPGLCGNAASNVVYKDGKWEPLEPYQMTVK